LNLVAGEGFEPSTRVAEAQARALLPGRYLRINHSPQPGHKALSEMDRVDASMTDVLMTLAKSAVDEASAAHGVLLRRILQ
jgi:hypothetical protein